MQPETHRSVSEELLDSEHLHSNEALTAATTALSVDDSYVQAMRDRSKGLNKGEAGYPSTAAVMDERAMDRLLHEGSYSAQRAARVIITSLNFMHPQHGEAYKAAYRESLTNSQRNGAYSPPRLEWDSKAFKRMQARHQGLTSQADKGVAIDDKYFVAVAAADHHAWRIIKHHRLSNDFKSLAMAMMKRSSAYANAMQGFEQVERLHTRRLELADTTNGIGGPKDHLTAEADLATLAVVQRVLPSRAAEVDDVINANSTASEAYRAAIDASKGQVVKDATIPNDQLFVGEPPSIGTRASETERISTRADSGPSTPDDARARAASVSNLMSSMREQLSARDLRGVLDIVDERVKGALDQKTPAIPAAPQAPSGQYKPTADETNRNHSRDDKDLSKGR